MPTLAKVSLGARDACSCVVVLELRAQVPPESVLTELHPGGRRDVPALCVHARMHVCLTYPRGGRQHRGSKSRASQDRPAEAVGTVRAVQKMTHVSP